MSQSIKNQERYTTMRGLSGERTISLQFNINDNNQFIELNNNSPFTKLNDKDALQISNVLKLDFLDISKYKTNYKRGRPKKNIFFFM